MAKQVIQSPDAPAAIGPYSQAIRAGNTVYLSGQIGLDPATGKLVEGIEAQAHQVFTNLRAVAEAAGGDARRHRQADDPAGRPRRLREGQRDHGDVLQAAVSGARDVPGGGACRAARASRSKASCCRAPASHSAQPLVAPIGRSAAPQAKRRASRERSRGRPRRQARAPRHRARADLVLHLPLRYEDHTQPRAARRAARRARRCRPRASSSTPRSSTGRGASSSACCDDPDARRRAARAALLLASIRASRRRSRRARACACSAKCATGTSASRSCIRSSASSTPDAPLPDRLTPVYPTTAGLAQDTLRKVIARALAADPARLAETLPEDVRAPAQLWKFGDAVHVPARAAAAAVAAHAAGARCAHASGVDAAQVRRAARAAAVAEGASQGARGAARAGADRHGRADRGAARARRRSSSRARRSACGARSATT